MTGPIHIAGIVILYNPQPDVINNINTYLSSLDRLFVIDNSESTTIDNYTRLDPAKVIYYSCNKNIGIAGALNLGISMALEENFSFCILFDQDTYAEPDLILNITDYLQMYKSDKIGIYSAIPHYVSEKKMRKANSKDLDLAISSGSVLSLENYVRVGPFIEKLFIDYVDFEYCLRLRKKGYRIVSIKDTLIFHSLGNLKQKTFLFKKIFITNHSPQRYYYRTRNRFYVYKSYFFTFPFFVLKDLVIFFNELIKIICYETQRLKKLHMVQKGFVDFLIGHYGELK